MMSQEKLNIIYFADPMCSTCYGFSPQLTKTLQVLGEDVHFRMIMGGLRPFNTETMEDLGGFLMREWSYINQLSGQPFKFDLLSDHTFLYDTEPACRAVVTIRNMAPELTFSFFTILQEAFYKENRKITHSEVITDLVSRFGVDTVEFCNQFESEAMRALTLQDFDYTSKIGVKKFPTLAVQRGEQLIVLGRGYVKAEALISVYKKSLSLGLDNSFGG